MLRIVILERPWLTITQNETAKALLSEVLEMRQRSFEKYYGANVNVMSQSDLFGDYLILCDEVDGKLIPVYSYKLESLSRAKEFNLEFGMFHHTEAQEDPEIHNEFIKTIASDDIYYLAAGVTCPNFQATNRRRLPEIKKIGQIGLFGLIKQTGDLYTIGALKSASWRLAQNLGFEIINGEPIYIETIDDHAYMMKFAGEPEGADENRTQYPGAWENRIVFTPKNPALSRNNAEIFR